MKQLTVRELSALVVLATLLAVGSAATLGVCAPKVTLVASRRTLDDPAAARAALIDVNTASVDELVLLPGIGPARARAIVAERARGPFTSVESLRRVRGIGPVTVERVRRYVTVSGERR